MAVARALKRTYKYGADAPLEGVAALFEQHALRRRYWNALAQRELHDRWQVAMRLKPLLDAGVCYRDAWRQERTYIQGLEQQRATYLREQRKAICREGLYFAGYKAVERLWGRACAKREAPCMLAPKDTYKGSVNLPFPEGLPPAALAEDHDLIALTPVPSDTFESRAKRRKQQRTYLRLRVATAQDKTAVFLKIPIYLHRPLPEDAWIRDVRVSWRTVAGRKMWSVAFYCALPQPQAASGNRAVALAPLWRAASCGVEAGIWADDEGNTGTIALGHSFLRGMAKVNELTLLREKHLFALRDALVAWLRLAPGVPEWLEPQTKPMASWNRPHLFTSLYDHWRQNRWHPDEVGFCMLNAWQEREKHLRQWQEHQQDKLVRYRREQYRRAAAELAARYDTLHLSPRPERACPENGKLRELQDRLLAPLVLEDAATSAFLRVGAKVEVRDKGECLRQHLQL